MKQLDKESKVPLYLQLADLLLEKIDQEMEVGSRLESERELCVAYGISRTTARLALDELERGHFISKVHGKGNFVANKYVEQNLIRFYSFTDEMKRLGKQPSSRFLGFEAAEADESLAQKLRIAAGDMIFRLSRVRLAADVPMMYEVTCLPLKRFAGLTIETLMSAPLYDLMRKEYGVKFAYAEELFCPVLMNKLESYYLNGALGLPALKIERYTYEENHLQNQPIEYTVSIARGDVFKYRVRLNRE